MNPSRTLRKLAEALPNGDIKTGVLTLAAELELQHNAQNNAFQGALSNAELGFENQLDVLTVMIGELRAVCNSSLAQSQHNAAEIQRITEKLDQLERRLTARRPGHGTDGSD